MAAKTELTAEQKLAVNTQNCALLVSAGAGAGKTKVLVHRILKRICDDEVPCSITDFLIITYTNAAAAELKSKIADAMTERLAAEPSNRHLRRQIALCSNASIGTIHSFCSQILRDNSGELGLSPDFRICEENEFAAVKRRLVDDILEEKYGKAEENPAFTLLVDEMGDGKNDDKLSDVILELYNSIQSHPAPEQWLTELENKLSNIGGEKDLSENIWGRYVIETAKDKTDYCIKRMEGLLEAEGCEQFLAKYGDSVRGSLADMRSFRRSLDEGWDSAQKHCAISFTGARPLKGFDDLKNIRASCKTTMEKVGRMFSGTSGENINDIIMLRPAMNELFHLVLEFSERFSREKIRLGMADFSDLEHLAIKVLYDREKGCQTETGKSISRRFVEIMVDEYQDVNRVQELIIKAVSKDGKNVFMVGDVKQSIYRFRLADPNIFLKKYNDFPLASESGNGDRAKVILSNNFRSRRGILEAVNFVFSNIMTRDFAEMDYTKSEYLNPMADYEDNGQADVELDVIDSSDCDESDADHAAIREAHFTAKRIKELMASDGSLWKNGKLRYGDFAILLRSVKYTGKVFSDVLGMYGIPTAYGNEDEFFKSVEISMILSVLNAIDNPYQDIPLVSAMSSPAFGFSSDDLAKIRTYNRKGSFFEAVVASKTVMPKTGEFLKKLSELRKTTVNKSVHELIWDIYNDTGLLSGVEAMNGGKARRDNLMRLFRMAVSFEKNGHRGLFDFLNYLRRLEESGKGPASETEGGDGDRVLITTIHKSKGLEYPVVFLPRMNKGFNNNDLRKSILIHKDYGAGTFFLDYEKKIKYSTLPRDTIAAVIKKEYIAEELRVLYVAMTRAKEKLIMLCSLPKAEKTLARIESTSSLPVDRNELEGAPSIGMMLLRAAIMRPEAGCLRQSEFRPFAADFGKEWDISLINGETLSSAAFEPDTEQSEEGDEAQPDEAEVENTLRDLRERLDYVYPHLTSAGIPSKLTATELKGSGDELDSDSIRAVKNREPEIRRPDFVSDAAGEMSSAGVGTAVHRVLECIDLSQTGTGEAIAGQIARLCNEGKLTAQQSRAVDVRELTGFFGSALGRRLRSSPRVYREFKFSVLDCAGEYFPESSEEILVQGVVDCCFEENGELVIIDYKTDRIYGDLEKKTRYYRPQAELYAKAMEQITGKRVKEKVIYFLSVGKAKSF